MTPNEIWHSLDVKLIAILRGVLPEETSDVVRALLGAGFRAIEITMNSPDPYRSVELALNAAEPYGPCLIGAGTVLHAQQVRDLYTLGANLIVSPDIAPDVVTEALRLGCASFPGVFTATEAHQAVRLGATGLKFFPASVLGPEGIKAIKATLPDAAQICAVGGVSESDFPAYLAAGTHGFGIGSNLYRRGKEIGQIARDAETLAQAFLSNA